VIEFNLLKIARYNFAWVIDVCYIEYERGFQRQCGSLFYLERCHGQWLWDVLWLRMVLR